MVKSVVVDWLISWVDGCFVGDIFGKRLVTVETGNDLVGFVKGNSFIEIEKCKNSVGAAVSESSKTLKQI